MILYAISVSTYSAKVRKALDFKGIDDNMQPPPGGYSTPEYMNIIPLGAIPGIKDGDLTISESDVITTYFEEKYPEPTLMSGNAQDHARQPKIQTWRDAVYKNPVVKAITDESRQATLDWMNSGGG